MTICPNCKDLNTVYRIRLPHELKQALRIAKQNVADNTISVVENESGLYCQPFNDVSDSGEWEGDVVHYVFKCNICGKKFELSAETYHGSGGKWKPI